jgi:hypothetical protein
VSCFILLCRTCFARVLVGRRVELPREVCHCASCGCELEDFEGDLQ